MDSLNSWWDAATTVVLDAIQRHPLAAMFVAYVIGVFPRWLQNVWGLFSKEPLFKVLAGHPWLVLVAKVLSELAAFALAAGVLWFYPRFGAAIVLLIGVLMLWRRNGRLPATTGTAGLAASPRSSVTVFSHTTANGELVQRVVRHFQAAGWDVASGTTELHQHSLGVFLRGAPCPERFALLWGLESLGLEAQVEDATDGSLQVIIGALRPSATLQATAEAGLLPIGVVQSVPPVAVEPSRLEESQFGLEWQQEKRALNFRVTNRTGGRVDGVEIRLRDLKRYAPDQREFLEAKDSQYVNDKFIAFRLNPPTLPIFHGKSEVVRFLSVDEHGYLICAGEHMRKPSPQRGHRQITEPGLWRMKIRLTVGDKSRDVVLCVEWKKLREIATPVACP